MSLNLYLEEEDNNKEVSVNDFKDLFLAYENKVPTLSESLKQLFKSKNLSDDKVDELTNDILGKCKKTIDKNFNEIKKKYNNITKDDAYIICAYTCESIDQKFSPYSILNKNLVSENRKKGVRNISKYLYIFLKSLRKLDRYYPSKTEKYLYRCITRKVALKKDDSNDKLVPYIKGNIKTFWGFTSTSNKIKTAFDFLKGEETKSGTIFSLGGDVWGYDITLFNYFGEAEILLEPERKFSIDNVIPDVNDIINITSTILTTPLILDKNSNESDININNNLENEENLDNDKISKLKEYIIRIELEYKYKEEYKHSYGIGLLCDIPQKNIKALITFNNIINFNYLNEANNIKLYIDNEIKEICLKKSRYKYTNEEKGITIIEILKDDDINNFIELDEFINSKSYINEKIIYIYYENEKNIKIIIDKIKGKNNDDYVCSIESKKEGIILLKNNLKLIGLIKNNNIVIPMDKIINKINFIKCLYNIQKEDLGKQIQIINNKGTDDNGPKNKEISKEIKLIINGEIISNIFVYKFNKKGIYTVYLVSQNNLKDISYMFYNCSSLIEINLSTYDTERVTNMSYMFFGCYNLYNLNLSKFNTEQVTDMSYMFYRCCSLKDLNLSLFNTKQVTNMSGMFGHCLSLKNLNLLSFNTDQVKDMSCMFSKCSSLLKLDLSSFDTKQVTNMAGMFRNCSSLIYITLSSFDTKNVKYMYDMFY